MNRKLKFDMTVASNAALCPNPAEFYSKSYISQDIVDNFRTLPGIKSETKLANVLFQEGVLKESSCSFDAKPSKLDAIDITVCAISAMVELCQFDLEQSFIADWMAAGSNSDEWIVNEFTGYFWNEVADKIHEEIETIRWNGDSELNSISYPLLSLCDGYIVQMLDDEKIIGVPGTAITINNVIEEMTSVYQALPAAVRSKKADLRFYVSSDVAAAYRIASASGNTTAFITKELDLAFLGIKITEQEGMPANTIVATVKQNMIYAFDGQGDADNLKIINLRDTVAEPYLRARTNLKLGFHYTNPDEIVFYSSDIGS